MLTGIPLSEIQKLRWKHFDLEVSELNLRNSKTGSRAVPLASSAVRLLTDLSRKEDNPYVERWQEARTPCHRSPATLAAQQGADGVARCANL